MKLTKTQAKQFLEDKTYINERHVYYSPKHRKLEYGKCCGSIVQVTGATTIIAPSDTSIMYDEDVKRLNFYTVAQLARRTVTKQQ